VTSRDAADDEVGDPEGDDAAADVLLWLLLLLLLLLLLSDASLREAEASSKVSFSLTEANHSRSSRRANRLSQTLKAITFA
jgi:hypothetical protein